MSSSTTGSGSGSGSASSEMLTCAQALLTCLETNRCKIARLQYKQQRRQDAAAAAKRKRKGGGGGGGENEEEDEPSEDEDDPSESEDEDPSDEEEEEEEEEEEGDEEEGDEAARRAARQLQLLSRTSMVTAENLCAMLAPREVERNLSVEQWFKKVRKFLVSALQKLRAADCAELSTILALMHELRPPIFLDKPTAHSQIAPPDRRRCVALCANGLRCHKQRNKNSTYLCTNHATHLPFGIDEAYRAEIEAANAELPIQLRLVVYRGISYYVDVVNNNVYDTTDIFRKSKTPAIVASYTRHTSPTGEEVYTISELD